MFGFQQLFLNKKCESIQLFNNVLIQQKKNTTSFWTLCLLTNQWYHQNIRCSTILNSFRLWMVTRTTRNAVIAIMFVCNRTTNRKQSLIALSCLNDAIISITNKIESEKNEPRAQINESVEAEEEEEKKRTLHRRPAQSARSARSWSPIITNLNDLKPSQ